jgi:hypothetical protein
MLYACKGAHHRDHDLYGAHTLVTGQREREREGEKERGREREREREKEREIVFIFKKNDGCHGTF